MEISALKSAQFYDNFNSDSSCSDTCLILWCDPFNELGQVLFEALGVTLVRLGDLLQEGFLRLVHKYHGGLEQSTHLPQRIHFLNKSFFDSQRKFLSIL
jgi:hypothetical protein